MLSRIAITCLAVLLAGLAAPAQADLVIDIAETTVPSGDPGTLNIYLQSTTGSSADAIDDYSLALTITGPNQLNFIAGGSTSYLGDANYLFSGDSYDANNLSTSPPYSIPMGYPSPGPTVVIGDYSNDFNPVIPSMSPDRTLLASLPIFAEATNPKEVYTVQVANASFSNLVSTDPNYTSPNFTISGGTITVVAAAVPEPASIVCGMTALVLLASFSQLDRPGRSEREACRYLRPGAEPAVSA